MIKKFYFLFAIFLTLIISEVKAAQLKKIIVNGNERIPFETIKMFSKVKIGQSINEIDPNKVLKELYNTYYFEDVSVELNNETLILNVVESPVIESINFQGIKAKKILAEIEKNLKLKTRSSFNAFLFNQDRKSIISSFLSIVIIFPSSVNPSARHIVPYPV